MGHRYREHVDHHGQRSAGAGADSRNSILALTSRDKINRRGLIVKISIVVPWLCAAGLLVAVVLLFHSNNQKDAELANVSESVHQVEKLRQAMKELETTSATQSNQLAELRNQQGELMRLRNESRQFREQLQQLTKEVQTAQSEALRVQAQAQAAQAQATQLAEAEKQRMAAVNAQAAYEARIKAVVDANLGLGTPQGQAAAACIGNLGQIEGAKQQWALENKKAATDTPTWDDIRPYLGRAAQALSCPAGGTYSINVLTAEPTCSIPGHAVPPR